jgi:C-terminal peptidase prc
VTLFARHTVAPLDADSFALDLAHELAHRVSGLAIRDAKAGAALVDAKDPSRALRLADLVVRPDDLAAFADAVAGSRPDLDAVTAYREALVAVVARVDPYATVRTTAALDERLGALDQAPAGLGISWEPSPPGVRVLEVASGSPAAKARIRPGDVIVVADGVSLAGLGVDAVRALLRGPEGTWMRLAVRAPSGAERDVVVVRRPFVFPAVRVTRAPGGVTVIAIANLTENAPAEMREALARNVPRPFRGAGVVLDLRDDSGGRVAGAYELANLLVRDGFLFRGLAADGREAARAEADPAAKWDRVPLVVLIDATTLSAAEVLAAALRDADRALLVGERSGGKGIGQRKFDLPRAQSLFVSTLRLDTASGRTIQGYGVLPHVRIVPGPADPMASTPSRQPYLWRDLAREADAPPLVVRADRVCIGRSADPPLAAALAILAEWKRSPEGTLLDAARRAFPAGDDTP